MTVLRHLAKPFVPWLVRAEGPAPYPRTGEVPSQRAEPQSYEMLKMRAGRNLQWGRKI